MSARRQLLATSKAARTPALAAVELGAKTAEVAQGVPANAHDASHVDGVGAGRTRGKRDGIELEPLVEVGKVGGKHDIGQVEVCRHATNMAHEHVAAHEAEGGVGVPYAHAKDEAQQQADHVLHELTGGPVAANDAVADDGVEAAALGPELLELGGVGLAV